MLLLLTTTSKHQSAAKDQGTHVEWLWNAGKKSTPSATSKASDGRSHLYVRVRST